jgi:hypothetical protein
MTKIAKSWQNSKDAFGFRNTIEIEVCYYPKDGTYSLERAFAYQERKTVITDLTDVFATVPEFNSIVDQIDWREVYAEEMSAKEEVYDEQ